MGVFDSLRAAFSSDSAGASDDEHGDYLNVDDPFDENFPEPDNKSTLGDEEWRWDRVDEQPFDHYTEATDRAARRMRVPWHKLFHSASVMLHRVNPVRLREA